jgi:hypothetical protein
MRFQVEIPSNSLKFLTLEASLNFSFKILFEYEEDTIRKVVPHFKPFTTIFYLKILKLGKVTFGSNQI